MYFAVIELTYTDMNTPEGKRYVERPRKRWFDDIKNDQEIGC